MSLRNNPGNRVILADVTLREHGQNVRPDELDRFTAPFRVRTAQSLAAAGITRMEVVSCVPEQISPAMAEPLVSDVVRGLGRLEDVEIVTLVPNRRGLSAFTRLGLGPEELGHTVGTFFSAVEEHNRANLDRSIAESLQEIDALVREATAAGIPFVAYVSAAFGFRPRPEGPVIPVEAKHLSDHVMRMFDLGARTVTLSDLQGVAAPDETRDTLFALLSGLPAKARTRVGYHPHHEDPQRGIALAEAACAAGIRLFDASLGAHGGCVTGAPGNVPTEGLAAALAAQGAILEADPSVLGRIATEFQQHLAS